jgi:glycosyltransferase involved in cell wall biosynthesis
MAGAPPLVSVVIPAFNAERWLPETLASALAQTYPSLEIILVDDGSEDRTAEIARAVAARDPRLTVLRQENRGVAAARNLGIAHAKGRFVAPLDHDDLWHPARIEKLVAAALAAPAPPGFAYSFFRQVDADSNLGPPARDYRCDGPAFHRNFYRNIVGHGSGALFDRAALLSAGGYDDRLRRRGAMACEDLLMQIQVARHHPVVCVPEYLVGYRITPGSLSRDQERMARSWRVMIAVLRADGVALPGRLLRWNRGRRAFHLAMSRAAAGRWLSALGPALVALVADPLYAALSVPYWLGRAVRRRRRAGPPAAPLAFADCAPEEPSPPAPPPGLAGRLLDRLDDRRLAWAAARDRAGGPL